LKNNPKNNVTSSAGSNCPDQIVKLYADDLKLFSKVDCGRDAAFLQTSVNRLLDWCSK